MPEAIRADVKAAVDTPADKRTEVQKYLAEKFAASLKVTPEQVAAELSDAERATVKKLEAEIAAAEARRIKWGKIQALYDVGPPPPTHLLLRGSEQTPGAEVQPGFLRVLCRGEADALGRSRTAGRGHERPPHGAGPLADRRPTRRPRPCWRG